MTRYCYFYYLCYYNIYSSLSWVMRLLEETQCISHYIISVMNQKRGSTNDQYEEVCILTVNRKYKLE